MTRWLRWVGLYFGAIFTILLTYAIAFNIGMRTIENEPQSLFHSLELVLVHMFSVGYATVYPSSDIMVSLVILINITGQLILIVGLLGTLALIIYVRTSSRLLRS